jgi:hypothetical protein
MDRDIQLMRRLARREEKPSRGALSIFDGETLPDRANYLSQLNVCCTYWDALRPVRKRRARTRNYVLSDQFKDLIKDDCGGWISEESYLKKRGTIPIKQNVLKPIFNNIKGQFRQSQHKPVVSAREPGHSEESRIMTNSLQGVHELNDTEELDAANLGEFMISGCIVQRLGVRWWSDRCMDDVYVENVSLPFMFWNTDVQDIRMHGLKLIGQIHDMHFQDVVLRFSKYHGPEYIRDAFIPVTSPVYGSADVGLSRVDSLDFYTPVSPNMVRVYEVWTKRTERRMYIHDRLNGTYEYVPVGTSGGDRRRIIEGIEAENASRINMADENNMLEMRRVAEYNLPENEAQLIDGDALPLIEYGEKYEEFWYVEYLTPQGVCLYEGYSPYSHREHPYVIRLHPLIDGVVHGLLWELLDQQRYINRMVMLLDMILSSSAKGVLMVPEDIIPAGMTKDDFADAWVRHDGVIYYIPKPHGKMPEQISANSTNTGIHEVIQMQLQWAQDISGVHSAIQGKDPKSGTAASLYAQEAANATLNNLDFITTYFNFLQRRDFKAVKLMQQYYTSPRVVAPSGAPEMDKLVYDPAAVANLEFTNSIDYVQNYGVYAQMVNETMLQLFQLGVIDGKMLLKYSTVPNSEALLQEMAQMEGQAAQMAQQGQAGQKI